MIFRRLYEPKLAQASYLIGCPRSGEALVVDPNRHVSAYLRAAQAEGVRIAHVTETHIHADFVSGARELAQRAGAKLYLSKAGGRDWQYQYAAAAGATLIDERSRIEVGDVEIQVLHVPGHTPEHLAFLVIDRARASEPMGLLSGDFIFVGDVGRPDLLERAAHVGGTMEESARDLYRSLQRARDLPDYLQIWPGHGAGSACGKALSAVPQSTLGFEKRFNWAFAIGNEAEFVRAVLEGQPDPPAYFARMKRINRDGPPVVGETPEPAKVPANELASLLGRNAIVVDTRPAPEYARGAVPGTISIPANKSFTTWAGSLLPYDEAFYLLVDPRWASIAELARDLAGIGFDRLAGYFDGDAIDSYRAQDRLQATGSLNLDELRNALGSNDKILLDVRGQDEWDAGHIGGSVNIPLGELQLRHSELPRNRPVIVHCQTGARGAIGASLLRARGFTNVRLFSGGFAAWSAAGLPIAR